MLSVIIEPERRWSLDELRELWRYRSLMWILAARDVRVRYKQAVIGMAWAVIQPVANVIVIVGALRFMHTPEPEGAPRELLVLIGLLPWQLFAAGVQQSSQSLVDNQAFITHIYFPRIIIPIAPVLAALVDFTVGAVLLLGVVGWTRGLPATAIFAPLSIGFVVATATVLGSWLSALTALYRDVRYALPLLLQVGMFATPVVYRLSSVESPWLARLLALNPMTGALEAFRWSLLDDGPFPLDALMMSGIGFVVLAYVGLGFFWRVERSLADRI